MYRKIKDMTWPAPCEKMAELEWWLRVSSDEDDITKKERVLAASIISAYMQMVSDTQKKRNFIVSELRQGPNI